jgi:hypothetical protein
LAAGEELVFLEVFDGDTVLRVDPEYLGEYFRECLEDIFGNGGVVLEFHFFDAESLGAFRIDFILHIDALEGKVSV